MDDFEKNNFLANYQKIEFLATTTEWLKVKKQRKSLAIKAYSTLQLVDSNTRLRSLEKDASEYSNTVDQKQNGSVNNYATPLKYLTAGSKIPVQASSWTTNLNEIKCKSILDTILIKKPFVPNVSSEISKLKITKKVAPQHVTPPVARFNFGNSRNVAHKSPTAGNQNFGSTSNQNPFGNTRNFSHDPPNFGSTSNQKPQTSSGKPNFGFNSNQNQFGDTRNVRNNAPRSTNSFVTARQELSVQNIKQNKPPNSYDPANSGIKKKSLGLRGNISSKFIPPKLDPDAPPAEAAPDAEEVDPRLKNIDPKMVELIKSEIMDTGSPITWDDIAGLEFAKKTIQEIVVWPLLRPDIFTGLRRPPKGILLFGPPGTGKTLIGKCIASQSQSTFFSISASSLTSKWIGDGEKMVRALFAVARCHQPAVIFIDEIDSLLTQRSDTEHESSRRMKTEFLVQLDGAATADEDRILIIGATNRPQELDEAARRRLVKRLYIPLPEHQARREIVERLMGSEKNNLTEADIDEIAVLTDGYSGADMKNLCAEASLGPIRSIHFSMMHNINLEQVRPINCEDFKSALNRVKTSVSSKDLEQYLVWDATYGSGIH